VVTAGGMENVFEVEFGNHIVRLGEVSTTNSSGSGEEIVFPHDVGIMSLSGRTQADPIERADVIEFARGEGIELATDRYPDFPMDPGASAIFIILPDEAFTSREFPGTPDVQVNVNQPR